MQVLKEGKRSHPHEHDVPFSEQLRMLTDHHNIPHHHHQNETTNFGTQQSRGKVRIISGKRVKTRKCFWVFNCSIINDYFFFLHRLIFSFLCSNYVSSSNDSWIILLRFSYTNYKLLGLYAWVCFLFAHKQDFECNSKQRDIPNALWDKLSKGHQKRMFLIYVFPYSTVLTNYCTWIWKQQNHWRPCAIENRCSLRFCGQIKKDTSEFVPWHLK